MWSLTRHPKLALSIIVAGMVVIGAGAHASALSGSDFQAARISDDSVFFNKNTMNTGDIQNFLNAKVPICDTNGTQPSSRSGYATRADWGRANGVPPPYICLKDYSVAFDTKAADAYCGAIVGGTKSAANIIFDVAQACGINPQVLIVLLQKEQSLISDDWPWPIQYRSATGYGCPDTASCDSRYYGFFNQVYNAGRQFKVYIQNPGTFNFAVGRSSYIQYNPNSGCGGSNLTLQTSATAALYNYTPYQPNQAALNNLYGSGDACSSYGNRNYWRMFHDWFGPSTGQGYVLAKSNNTSDLRQWVVYGSIKQYVPSAEIKAAWGLPDQPIEMEAGYLNNIATGPDLDRLMRSSIDPAVLYLLDNGKRYAITDSNLVAAWGLSGRVTSYVSQDLFALPADGGYLSYSLKSLSSGTTYMTDGVNGSNVPVIRPYASTTVFRAWEGDAAWVTELSAAFFGEMDNAIGSTISTTRMSYGGADYSVTNGTKKPLNAPIKDLFPATVHTISSTTFNRLPASGSMTSLLQAVNSPTVYLVDNGYKHQLLWPNSLTAWTAPGQTITQVPSAFLDLLSTGDAIGGYLAESGSDLYLVDRTKKRVPTNLDDAYRGTGTVYAASNALLSMFVTHAESATGFIRGKNSPQVFLLDNSSRRRLIEWPDKLRLWAGSESNVTIISDYIVDTISTAVSPAPFVTDGTANYVIEGGKKWTVSSSIKSDWGFGTAQAYSDGTLDRFETGGALDNKLRDNFGGYFMVRQGYGYVTGDPNIADMWGIAGAAIKDYALVTSQLRVFMLTRFVESTTDSRTFIVNNGQWYNVSAGHIANFNASNEYKMRLDPALAPSPITDWPSAVVRSGSGSYYVIDKGVLRTFPHPMIKDQWTGFGSTATVLATNGLLNTMPVGRGIERAVKGTQPMVYSVESGYKRHIRYPDTYNQYYAPYTDVSSELLGVLPDGPAI